MEALPEKVTVVVGVRDRFSTMTSCLETLLANTAQPVEVLAVAGAAPERLKHEWVEGFRGAVRFIFRPERLNQAEARIIALAETTTRLAVLMDDDVYVHPKWLEPLVACQRETGAALVVPVILESERRIHTAGNDLFITYENGKSHGHKELRFHGLTYGAGGSNLTRRRTDYAELHCQLVEVEATRGLGAYDERLREVGEVDQGLTLAKAGREMWFEPGSVVRFALRSPVAPEDVALFAWRWDMRAILEGYRHFESKWGIDITEHGSFRDFLVAYNAQVGLLPRAFPARWALALGRGLERLYNQLLRPFTAPRNLFRRYRAMRFGSRAWPPRTSG